MSKDLLWDRWHDYPAEEPSHGDLVDLEFDKGMTSFPDDPTSKLKSVKWDIGSSAFRGPIGAELKRWKHLDEETAAQWMALQVSAEASYQERQRPGSTSR